MRVPGEGVIERMPVALQRRARIHVAGRTPFADAPGQVDILGKEPAVFVIEVIQGSAPYFGLRRGFIRQVQVTGLSTARGSEQQQEK